MVDIGKLETRIKGAFLWLGLLSAVCGAALLFIVSSLNDLRKDVGDVKASVASQAATTTGLQGSLTRIEDKLDRSEGSKLTPGRNRAGEFEQPQLRSAVQR
jgi:hypothetical protein